MRKSRDEAVYKYEPTISCGGCLGSLFHLSGVLRLSCFLRKLLGISPEEVLGVSPRLNLSMNPSDRLKINNCKSLRSVVESVWLTLKNSNKKSCCVAALRILPYLNELISTRDRTIIIKDII